MVILPSGIRGLYIVAARLGVPWNRPESGSERTNFMALLQAGPALNY